MFLRCLLVLSYLVLFLSKEQNAGYVRGRSLLTSAPHCRAVGTGLAILLQCQCWGSFLRVTELLPRRTFLTEGFNPGC